MTSRVAILVLLALSLSQVLALHVRRESPMPSFQDVVDNMRTHLEALGTKVGEAFGIQGEGISADQIRTLVDTKTRELEERGRVFIDEAKRQLQDRRADMSEATARALEEATQHVNATLERVKEAARDAPNNVEGFNQTFKKGAETLMAENSKLAHAAGEDTGAAHDQLADLARNTMSYTSTLMENFAREVQALANKASS